MSDAGTELTSTANPRVKAVVRLRDRRERETTGHTIVDGAREIDRALAAGVQVIEAFVDPGLAASDDARAVLRRLRGMPASSPLTTVSRAVFEKLAFGDRSDGIVAVIEAPHARLVDLRPSALPLLGVLEGVEKPGNIGAVMRSADGAGLDAVIVAGAMTDPFNPNAIRASLGAVFTRPLVAASTEETLAWLRGIGVYIVAARVDARMLHTDADLAGPVAIVLGSESKGLTEAWNAPDVVPVRLPMLGTADSLNVSAAAAILFYEALRQRRASMS